MRCPTCDTPNAPEARFCAQCGAKLASDRAAVLDIEEEDAADGGGAVETLIPYKNAKALSAYYFGIFSLIPGLGLVLGPMALIFGIFGIRHSSLNPRARGTGHAVVGTILGLLTFILNVVGLIMLVTNWRLAKETWKVYIGR